MLVSEEEFSEIQAITRPVDPRAPPLSTTPSRNLAVNHRASSSGRPAGLIGLLTLLLFPASPVLSAGEKVARGPSIEVLLIESTSEVEKDRGLAGRLRSGSRIQLRTKSWEDLRSADLEGIDCIVLGSSSLPKPPDSLVEVIRAVREGRGLVVTAAALRRWPESVGYSTLIRREEILPVGEKLSKFADVIEVPDQRNEITQSVPHFIHRTLPGAIRPSGGSRVLLRAPVDPREEERASPRSLAWLGQIDRGGVMALDLDLEKGASPGLVTTLLLRGVEWAAGRPAFGGRAWITVPVSGEYVLAASRLGPQDTGAAPGLPPVRGFYRGRQVSQTMSFHGAPWLTREERDREEQPEKVLDALGIRPGESVCDLGAGNGYFTLRMARRVGPKGRVFAVDIQEEMLELLERRQREAGLENIELVLSTLTDSRLGEKSVSLVLMVDVYHELSHPAEVLATVKRALKPGGRVVLVEYRGEDPLVPIKPLHRMFERQAIAEMEAQGFRWIKTHRFLRTQHVLEFGIAEKR